MNHINLGKGEGYDVSEIGREALRKAFAELSREIIAKRLAEGDQTEASAS